MFVQVKLDFLKTEEIVHYVVFVVLLML